MAKQRQINPEELASGKCVPCEGGVDPLAREEFEVYLPQVSDWQVVEDKAIEKEWVMKNFEGVMDLVNKIAEVAETEGHHPDMWIHSYKKLKVVLTTHAIGGLSVNDFIVAVKIDQISLG